MATMTSRTTQQQQQQQQQRHAPTTAGDSTAMTSVATTNNEVISAVPTLKVMRLQKPELDMMKAGTLNNSRSCLLSSALCLPDSFGVIHVGETFTAYLGALNVSKRLTVTKLTVTAQLQTPSQRWHLASKTLDDCNAMGGIDLLPEDGIDAIVSHALEEAGQHILRVEVAYGGTGGSAPKSLRKFYRFQVTNPLVISELTYRVGDSSCFVSISLQNNGHESKGGLTISSAEFDAAPGLVAEKIDGKKTKTSSTNNNNNNSSSRRRRSSGVDLLNNSGRMEPGDSKRYIFKVTMPSTSTQSSSPSAAVPSIKGIAAGDILGKAVFTWRKACGEMGRIGSTPIICPVVCPIIDPTDPGATMKGTGSDFVMHVQGSGLSVDVANQAVNKAISVNNNAITMMGGEQRIADLLPVTVEPINPPTQMQLGVPYEINFLVVNHSDQYMTPQLQFRLEHMKGIAVCGPSFKNLEEIAGNGGTGTVPARFIALSTGLVQMTGCCIVNLSTGHMIPQPPMMNAFVVEN
jgi:hypothetical protein